MPSIYTVRSDGAIAAKGIHSGGGGGGSDHWGGYFDPCYEYYTDIWQASTAFRERYGRREVRHTLLTLAVVALLTAAGGCSSRGTSVRIDSFERAGDRSIVITVTIGEHDTVRRTTVTEDADRVTVDVIVDVAQGTGTDVGVKHDISVTLTDPLGERRVIDGTGHEVLRTHSPFVTARRPGVPGTARDADRSRAYGGRVRVSR